MDKKLDDEPIVLAKKEDVFTELLPELDERFMNMADGKCFVLDKDKNIVPVHSVLEWARWYESFDENKRVALTEKRGVRVSTVFLGIDHGFNNGPGDPPVLFETMVFGGKYSEEQWRCCTWPEAVELHNSVCKIVFMPWYKRLFYWFFGLFGGGDDA